MVMRQRQLDILTYSENGISSIDIPREHWGKKITLMFLGEASTGAGTVSKSEYNPFEIIKRVEVLANGGQLIKSLSGKMLYLQNILEHGTKPYKKETPSNASVNNASFGGALTIYFDKDKDFIETLLPTHVLSSLSLKIVWGAPTDIEKGVTLTINKLHCYPLFTEEINIGQSTEGIGVLKEVEYIKQINASGWTEIDLPIGNVYQNLKILARNNNLASDDIISELEVVKDGLEVIRKVRFDQSKAEDLIEYALEYSNQPTGYTIQDFNLGGSAPINTANWSSLKLRLNVSTTPTPESDVTVVAEEIILPK